VFFCYSLSFHVWVLPSRIQHVEALGKVKSSAGDVLGIEIRDFLLFPFVLSMCAPISFSWLREDILYCVDDVLAVLATSSGATPTCHTRRATSQARQPLSGGTGSRSDHQVSPADVTSFAMAYAFPIYCVQCIAYNLLRTRDCVHCIRQMPGRQVPTRASSCLPVPTGANRCELRGRGKRRGERR
jgi:hypothetical protein